jgi:hypothetical protein
MISKDHLEKLRLEFEDADCTEERRTEIVQYVIASSVNWDFSPPYCMNCKNAIIYIPYNHALCKGHVYSREGVEEVSITSLCEYCFDNITQERNDPDFFS